MPLFRSKSKNKDKDKKAYEFEQEDTNLPAPTLPPPPPPEALKANAASPDTSYHLQRELVFRCQLAHGSATKEIKDFANVKDMYARIAVAFEIASSEIIFCTLNTHKVDMTQLLGGQIGLDDFIFAHVRGTKKEVSVVKIEPAIGLTITDNGDGYAFVKRLREGSVVSRIPEIAVGDLVESINGKSMVGCRHHEVAKFLKDLPLSMPIALVLVEPMKAFDAIAPRRTAKATTVAVLDQNTQKLEELLAKGEGRATLRLKKDGQAVVEQVVINWETKAADNVDDLLEQFLGIRDMELSTQLVELCKGKELVDNFALAVDEHLGEFEFPSEFVIDIWKAIASAKGAAFL
eukprot:Em0011g148a